VSSNNLQKETILLFPKSTKEFGINPNTFEDKIVSKKIKQLKFTKLKMYLRYSKAKTVTRIFFFF